MTTTNPTSIAPQHKPYVPLRERINIRLILFIVAIGAPFVGIGYVMFSNWLTGGIRDHGEYASVDLRALGNFPFHQTNGTIDKVPADYRALDGRRVELKGFMVADNLAAGAGAEFQIVYDVNKCCFGGPPQIQERVFCKVPKGKKVEIYPYTQLARVIGTLRVRVVKGDEGVILSVFDLEVDVAERV